jgi:hypothetical protein
MHRPKSRRECERERERRVKNSRTSVRPGERVSVCTRLHSRSHGAKKIKNVEEKECEEDDEEMRSLKWQIQVQCPYIGSETRVKKKKKKKENMMKEVHVSCVHATSTRGQRDEGRVAKWSVGRGSEEEEKRKKKERPEGGRSDVAPEVGR